MHIYTVATVILITIMPLQSFSESDNIIRDKIIAASIADYRGNCPCPDFRDRAGKRCGKRSAYSKAGGASPLCYRSDVTPEMIRKYKGKKSR